jgi:hypothetical protein
MVLLGLETEADRGAGDRTAQGNRRHRRRDDRWADGKGCVIAAIALQA